MHFVFIDIALSLVFKILKLLVLYLGRIPVLYTK